LTVLDTLPADSIDLPDRASAAGVYLALERAKFLLRSGLNVLFNCTAVSRRSITISGLVSFALRGN
jgi:hypothetical protein